MRAAAMKMVLASHRRETAKAARRTCVAGGMLMTVGSLGLPVKRVDISGGNEQRQQTMYREEELEGLA